MKQSSFQPLKDVCTNLLHAKIAHCETNVAVVPVHNVKRAGSEKLRQIFDKYVSITRQGDKFMTPDDFVRKFLGLYPDENFDPETVRLLGSVADTSKDGLISFAEFQAFEAVLCLPDALYMTAFSLFDTNGSGKLQVQSSRTSLKSSSLVEVANDVSIVSEFSLPFVMYCVTVEYKNQFNAFRNILKIHFYTIAVILTKSDL